MLQKRTTLPTILNWYNLWLMGVAVTVEMFKPCSIMSLIDHKTSKTIRAVIAFRSEALYHNQAILLYGLIIDKKNLRTVIIQHYY